MSLMRLIQENGTMFSMKPYACEVEVMKQIIKEKNVLIDNHVEKIKELENRLTELETALEARSSESVSEKNKSEGNNSEENLKNENITKENECKQLIAKQDENKETVIENKNQERPEEIVATANKENTSMSTARMNELVNNYEKFISEISSSYEVIKEQRNIANEHLACLECSFADLVEKYERLKNVVVGYQENQEVLLEHIDTYKNAMQLLQKRYDDLKSYAHAKLNEASVHIEKKDKKHISEMAKVKGQVLHSKVKISELEKTIFAISSNANAGQAGDTAAGLLSKTSPFSPLINCFELDK